MVAARIQLLEKRLESARLGIAIGSVTQPTMSTGLTQRLATLARRRPACAARGILLDREAALVR